MLELSFNQIMKYMGINLIFKDLNFHVYEGDRVGYDYGSISRPKEATIAYLDQIPNYPDAYTVRDVLNSAFEEVLEIEQKMRSLEKKMQVVEGEALDRILKQYSRLITQYDVNR